MSDIEEDIVSSLDAETAQKLCEEFASITGTDTACAQFYLQDRKWDLELSINAYFEDTNSTLSNLLNEEQKGVKKEKSLTAATDITSQVSADKPGTVKLISWNLDGLDEVELKARTKFVCNIIKSETPDVVFFQEVVPASMMYIEKYLPAYKCIPGNHKNYFCVTLVCNKTVSVLDTEIVPFPSSLMERNMIIVTVKIADVHMVLINSHLESTKDHSEERKNQLTIAFKQMIAIDANKTVLFGGDLNLRDKELENLGGIPDGIEDLWKSCGERPECEYTWDATRNDNKLFPGRFKPRLRFDRIYLKHSKSRGLNPRHFGLIGLERLKSCRRFPSDHWGLVVYFNVL